MKNKDFFYQQYEKIAWENQEKTKINERVNKFIISEIISKRKSPDIKIFDIGFGIGFFIKMLCKNLGKKYKKIRIEGCEPSEKNYTLFTRTFQNTEKNVSVKVYHSTFLNTSIDEKFDFITAIYVFPHFIYDELEKTAEKIYTMLEKEGKFILVVANEAYLEKKLQSMKDLFIEKCTVTFNGREYKEVLHYSDIPEIGKIIDYNREEQFYLDLFAKHGFTCEIKKELDDNSFICTLFVFQKV